MNYSFLISFLLLITGVFQSYSQIGDSLSTKLPLLKITQINQSDSYITLPTDIGNIEPLMFEANVSPSFTIRGRNDSRLMAVLTSQIIIRMYNEDSYPVRTPSYIPQISFYYLVSNKQASNSTTFFGRLGHHSNGQDNSFYDEDLTINLQSGNFATNFFEIGALKTSYSKSLKSVKVLKSSLEIHPQSWMYQELQGQYSGFRWHNSFMAFKLPLISSDNRDRPNFSLKAETTLMFDNFNDLDFFDLNRFNASIIFYYHPKFLEDIGLFVQFYHGMDYYNIYFNHQISVIRFGIMTEILRF